MCVPILIFALCLLSEEAALCSAYPPQRKQVAARSLLLLQPLLEAEVCSRAVRIRPLQRSSPGLLVTVTESFDTTALRKQPHFFFFFPLLKSDCH